MALVRYKKFVHKNRACSNIKNKTTLPTKSCNILQIRLDNLARYLHPCQQLWRPKARDRMHVALQKSDVSQLLSIDQWTVSSNWSRNQIKVDQGEFDPFVVDIYLETDQNDPKINQNDP